MIDLPQQTTVGMGMVRGWLATHLMEALGDSLAPKGEPLGKLAKQALHHSAPFWRRCLPLPHSRHPTGGA